MSNAAQVARWHADKPEWAKNLTARDWDTAELIAEQLDTTFAGENVCCDLAPTGSYCIHEKGHSGPCRIYELP